MSALQQSYYIEMCYDRVKAFSVRNRLSQSSPNSHITTSACYKGCLERVVRFIIILTYQGFHSHIYVKHQRVITHKAIWIVW